MRVRRRLDDFVLVRLVRLRVITIMVIIDQQMKPNHHGRPGGDHPEGQNGSHEKEASTPHVAADCVRRWGGRQTEGTEYESTPAGAPALH